MADAAAVLSNLGNLAQDRHDLLRASRYFDGARQLYCEIDDRRSLALVLNNLALIALERHSTSSVAQGSPRLSDGVCKWS